MSMIEAVQDNGGGGGDSAGDNGFTGSEGLFAAIESRGLTFNDPDFANATPATGIGEFDEILPCKSSGDLISVGVSLSSTSVEGQFTGEVPCSSYAESGSFDARIVSREKVQC